MAWSRSSSRAACATTQSCRSSRACSSSRLGAARGLRRAPRGPSTAPAGGGHGGGGGASCGRAPRAGDRGRSAGDPWADGQVGRAGERLAQAAHVVGPVVQAQRLEGRDLEPQPRPLAQEVAGQRPDVLGPLAQGRQADRLGAQAGGDVRPQRAHLPVGGGQDAGVDPPALGRAQRLQVLVLQEAEQLGLHLGRDLGELVEEQRPVLGLVDEPQLVPVGLRVGPLDVAEQLALDERARAGRRS